MQIELRNLPFAHHHAAHPRADDHADEARRADQLGLLGRRARDHPHVRDEAEEQDQRVVQVDAPLQRDREGVERDRGQGEGRGGDDPREALAEALTLDQGKPLTESRAEVEELIRPYDMTNYTEWFTESFVWNTNWKILAENFMESYHLPVCHAGTIGGLSKLDEMICPPSPPHFNWHTILKDPHFKIACAHPGNTRMEGDLRRTTMLLALYPSFLITLTPGYFWYLSLHPKGVGQVQVNFGGGMSNDFLGDADVPHLFATLKGLLDKVNVEDKGCTEKVYRGLCSDLATPGHLSHLERPNYDFATYLSSKVGPG